MVEGWSKYGRCMVEMTGLIADDNETTVRDGAA